MYFVHVVHGFADTYNWIYLRKVLTGIVPPPHTHAQVKDMVVVSEVVTMLETMHITAEHLKVT